jgi:hypothetical protein
MLCSTTINFLDFLWNRAFMLSVGRNHLVPSTMVAYDTAIDLS